MEGNPTPATIQNPDASMTGNLCKRIAGVLVAVFGSVAVLSAKPAARKIVLEHADTLRSQGDRKFLIGNVAVLRGTTKIWSDRAVYNSRQGYLDLTGNVRMNEPDRRMTAKQATYYEDSGNYEASGDVDFMQRDSVRIRCRLARYYEDRDMVELYDNVVIDNMNDNSTISGRWGTWVKSDQRAVVEGDAKYRLPDEDSDPPDTLVILSNKLVYYKTTNSALFTGEVELTMGNLQTISDSLFHQPDSNLTILSGAPVIWKGPDKLSGKRVELTIVDRDLKRIYVAGEATALSEAMEGAEQYNRLSGAEMTITLVDDSTRVVRVKGDAEGEYHVWDENNEYQGVNSSAANVIQITVVAEKTRSIELKGSTAGAFYPPGKTP